MFLAEADSSPSFIRLSFHALSALSRLVPLVEACSSPSSIRLSFACLSRLFGTGCFFSDVLASLFSLWPFLFSFVCRLTIIFIILQSFSLFRVGSNFRFCRRSFRVSSHFFFDLNHLSCPIPFLSRRPLSCSVPINCTMSKQGNIPYDVHESNDIRILLPVILIRNIRRKRFPSMYQVD